MFGKTEAQLLPDTPGLAPRSSSRILLRKEVTSLRICTSCRLVPYGEAALSVNMARLMRADQAPVIEPLRQAKQSGAGTSLKVPFSSRKTGTLALRKFDGSSTEVASFCYLTGQSSARAPICSTITYNLGRSCRDWSSQEHVRPANLCHLVHSANHGIGRSTETFCCRAPRP
jgi:hypothetical protein